MIHQNQPIAQAGKPLDQAAAAMILIHGRGASAHSILELANEVHHEGFAYLAPQAAGYTWYPNRFIAPIESNQPHLDSALALVGQAVGQARNAGISPEKIILLGFSQGACLALDYAARHPMRYGGVIGLSGGLIGQTAYAGGLDGTPIFLGCSDADFHIPLERVDESAAIFEALGADVTKRIYPGMGHTVNRDELAFTRELMKTVAAS